MLRPPGLSQRACGEAGVGAVEAVAISFVGSVLAVCIAVPLAVATTRSLLYRGVLYEGRALGPGARAARVGIYAAVKALLNLLRTIPEILWALIFVFMVGLGPFPGVLALGFHTGGALGKLFGEVIDGVGPRPLGALQASGGGRLRILPFLVPPYAAPPF